MQESLQLTRTWRRLRLQGDTQFACFLLYFLRSRSPVVRSCLPTRISGVLWRYYAPVRAEVRVCEWRVRDGEGAISNHRWRHEPSLTGLIIKMPIIELRQRLTRRCYRARHLLWDCDIDGRGRHPFIRYPWFISSLQYTLHTPPPRRAALASLCKSSYRDVRSNLHNDYNLNNNVQHQAKNIQKFPIR